MLRRSRSIAQRADIAFTCWIRAAGGRRDGGAMVSVFCCFFGCELCFFTWERRQVFESTPLVSRGFKSKPTCVGLGILKVHSDFVFPNHFYICRSFVGKKYCIFLVVLWKQFNIEREESTRFLDIYLDVDSIPEYENMKKRKMMRRPIFSTLVGRTIWDSPLGT